MHVGRYAVLEREEGLSRALAEWFGAACLPGEGPQLLVVSPQAAQLQPGQELECGTVLLPGDAGGLLERIRSRTAVSYGLSARDSITLSSRRGRRMCVAVQRELVGLDGRVLERQEFVLDAPPQADTMTLLALTGARLLMGGQGEHVSGGTGR